MLFYPYKKVHTFPKWISLKVNVIARLGFELAYFEVAVQPLRYGNFLKDEEIDVC